MVLRTADLVSQAGLNPLEAIAAATPTAARVLGNDDVHGTIAVGQRADPAILRADSSLDIQHTRQVALVIKAGVVYGVDGRPAGVRRRHR